MFLLNRLFTQKATHALERCPEIAGTFGHTYIGSEHLLIALSEEEDSVASHFLEEKAAYAEKLRHTVEEVSGIGTPTVVTPADMTPRLKHVIERSGELAESVRARVGTEHLLRALLEEKESVGVGLLSALSVDVTSLQKELRLYEERKREGGITKYSSPIERLPYLGKYGRDLNRAAAEGSRDPLIGREEEMNDLIRILTRRTKNNPCLIGEPGVGKSAIAEGLAARIYEKSVPEALLSKTVVLLDLPAMIAGAKYRGEFEDRLKGVLEEVSKNKNILLFIDEMHTLIGAGAAEGAVDASNILKPALARGEIQLIGATTLKEYRMHVEKDAALCRRFREIHVAEPSVEESIRILKGLKDRYESHHGLLLTEEAIHSAVILSARYVHERFLPDKAIDLIDEAAANIRLQNALADGTFSEKERHLRAVSAKKLEAIALDNFEKAAKLRDEETKLRAEIQEEREKSAPKIPDKKVTEADIAAVLSARTGLSSFYLTESEEEKLLRLEEEMEKRVVGQKEPLAALCRAVRRGKVRIEDKKRPLGSFLFLGEAGVGKTALCRALADVLFGSEEALIRLDMSEYMEKHAVSKIIGAPPGYIGYGEGGQLTEKIRRRPYAVLLFDEIEKAHPDIFDLLLQVMEDGVLTDSEGRRVDFSNIILILTSNVGAKECAEYHPLGFARDAANDAESIRRRALTKVFRPEFLNRLDEIIVFKPLGEKELTEIAERRLNEFAKAAAERDVFLSFSEEVAPALARICLKNGTGARPLARAMTKYIEDPLSLLLLKRKGTEALFPHVGVKEGIPYMEEETAKSVSH